MTGMEWNGLSEVEEIYDFCDDFVDEEADLDQLDAAVVLARCVNTYGRVDLSWMAEQSGLSVQELIDALRGAIFQDPEAYDLNPSEDTGWSLRAQYVSGHLKAKLEKAVALNRQYNGRFNQNILALRQAMPERVPFEKIGVSIGSSWVPASFYAAFAKDVLELTHAPKIYYSTQLGQWKVHTPEHARYAIHNLYTYGTERMSALKILEHTLNAGTVKVYDEVVRPDRKSGIARILNKNETLAVQEKQQALQEAFCAWVGKDPDRICQLEEIYYHTFACIVNSRYDGGFLTLPGLNPAFVPYQHQKNAVARLILDQDVLLNHVVGSGKTNILVMALHERKRMGLSRKNLVVVPNNVLEAFERAHRYLYPDDKILVIRPEREFKSTCRQKTLEQIRDEDCVAVYMAYSSFDLIPMSRRYRLDQKEAEIRTLRAKANLADDVWEKHQLDSIVSRLCKELAKMEKTLPDDVYLPFDELGITTLVVDEAHNFKNVSVKTRTDNVVGMHATGSAKCDALLEKSRYVREHGGSLIFASGTPLTNSISDLFVLQQFLQPEQLELLHLSHFDEWIGSFAARQSGFEVDLDSQNFRIMTRFSRFHNLPELMSLFSNVCDFYNGTDGGFGLPRCDGYIDTVVPKSAEQTDYIDELVYRTELCRAKLVESHEDNPLKITHDGRAVALDIRLVEPERKPDPKRTKTYACARNVYRCWRDHPGTAQLVFCDLGTPKKGFNVYDELKACLMAFGVPEAEIAFVHDAETAIKRRKLFEAVNKATVRVLIGSTSKLGVGVNVQENLIAIHHLDIPWKPSDMVQRDGRLIRQGNRNEQVYRYRYITAGTFDAYSWQIVENKQRFISQFMGGVLADRETQDIDDAVLTYAEIKALSVGDPLLKARIETSNELERTKIHSRRREQELKHMQQIVEEAPGQLEVLAQRKERLLEDRAHFNDHRERLTRQERTAFGEDLLDALAENSAMAQERIFDDLHGFRVLLPANMHLDRPRVILQGVTSNRYEVDLRDAKAAGCVQRMEHLLMHLGDRIDRVQDHIKRVNDEVRQAQAALLEGNGYARRVSILRQKLLEIDEELNRHAEQCVI